MFSKLPNFKKILLSVVLAMSLVTSAFAAREDAYSYSYWSGLSGVTTGTTNEIMFNYFGSLGYTGTFNDRYHAYLVDITGLSSSLTLNDLIYEHFVLGVSVGGSTNGQLTFLGDNLLFTTNNLIFNP